MLTEVWGIHPQLTRESHCKLPRCGPGQSPGRKWIWCILSSIAGVNASGDNEFGVGIRPLK